MRSLRGAALAAALAAVVLGTYVHVCNRIADDVSPGGGARCQGRDKGLRSAEEAHAQTTALCERLGEPVAAVYPRASVPNVLFVVDRPSWAYAFKACAISRRLHGVRPLVVVYEDVTAPLVDEADVVFAFWWQLTVHDEWKHLHAALWAARAKLHLGVCSHSSIGRSHGEDWSAKLRQLLSDADRRPAALFANSKLLVRALGGHVAESSGPGHVASAGQLPLVYSPNGVSTDVFRPANATARDRALSVGWAGSLRTRALASGSELKGVRSVLVPALRAVPPGWVAPRIASPQLRAIPRAQMPRWMAQLDVYVVASTAEGTPNPALEAAAAGAALITTPVGTRG